MIALYVLFRETSLNHQYRKEFAQAEYYIVRNTLSVPVFIVATAWNKLYFFRKSNTAEIFKSDSIQLPARAKPERRIPDDPFAAAAAYCAI